jgi:release factor glutamine methyltransferase
MADVWTVDKILSWTINHFTSHKIPEPRLSAELLLSKALNCKRIDLYLQFERILSIKERDQFREYVKRRARREPVQYILGETEFYGFPFKVNKDVIVPRPETELLVDAVVEEFQSTKTPAAKILDIGTGSGCIPVSLAKLLPDCSIWAIDSSTRAVEVARDNADLNEVAVNFVDGDIFGKRSSLPPIKFDIIVSNPPYVALKDVGKLEPEVRDFEPKEALFAGEDGLEFYRKIVNVIPDLIDKKGKAFFEIGYDQTEALEDIFAKADFGVQFKKDYNQIERILIIERKN